LPRDRLRRAADPLVHMYHQRRNEGGNLLAEEEQWAKLRMLVEFAHEAV
jgi:hypothetical protein